ncbi:MAG: hypothetical protein FWB75_00595 [Oscillospiraceae bacterium]|nr:hypothetical protein [Oscillospiraceae bacterium]
MGIGEVLRRMFIAFFVIFTGIALSVVIIRAIMGIRYDFLFGVPWMLLTAALTDCMFLVVYSRKELSKKKMIIRHSIALACVLVIVTVMVNTQRGFPLYIWAIIWIFVVLIFTFVMWMDLYRTQKLVGKISKKLKSRYKD